MNVLIFNPSFNPHGGVRVIIEWANHLRQAGHHVVLHTIDSTGKPDWITVDPGIAHQSGTTLFTQGYDHIIATTPQIAHALSKHRGQGKVWYFLQMTEELFSKDSRYAQTCVSSYYLGLPIITISHWIEYRLRMMGVVSPIHQIGNGFDARFVPGIKDDQPTVLVANWEGFNPCKDVEKIGPRTARYLKQKYGMRVLSYSGLPLHTMPEVCDEFYTRATTEQLISLYQRATITVQATKLDAWSTVGMESLACGTPLVRAITCGDEYLRHKYNCLRSSYQLDELIYLADLAYLNEDLREHLREGGFQTISNNSWPYWINHLEHLLTDDNTGSNHIDRPVGGNQLLPGSDVHHSPDREEP